MSEYVKDFLYIISPKTISELDNGIYYFIDDVKSYVIIS